MFGYSLTMWGLLFFIYSFLGWVWESSYVSIRTKKWTNRGFMSGPFLPIYGSGAILILLTTFPVRDSMVGIYFIGTLTATLLELGVGYFTELFYNVRYWDYSNQKFQYKGYICLSSSIAWGFFAILLVDYLNVPIMEFLSQYSQKTLDYAFILILIPFVMDMTKSSRDGNDLKKLLNYMKENNENVANLLNYLEGMNVKLGEDSKEAKEFMENLKTSIADGSEYTNLVTNIHANVTNTIESIDNQLKEVDSQNKLTEVERAKKEEALQAFKDLNNKLVSNDFAINKIDFSNFKGPLKLLKRNPTANTNTKKQELETLNNIDIEK